MHSVFSFDHSMPFEFPPGHKVRICSFEQNYNRKISPILNCTAIPSFTSDNKQGPEKRPNNTKYSPQSHGNHKISKISIALPSNKTPLLPSIPPESKECRQVQSSI